MFKNLLVVALRARLGHHIFDKPARQGFLTKESYVNIYITAGKEDPVELDSSLSL